MARKTVAQVLQQISSTVNQESIAPATGSDEFNLWMEYLNRSQDEWAEATDWESGRVQFFPEIDDVRVSLVTLPNNFKKLAAPVKLFLSGSQTPIEYSYMINENEQMFDSTDLYVKLTGDLSTGKGLIFNPGTLSSGVSLLIQYFSFPTSLVTTTQYLTMVDSQFAIDRTIAYIFEARSDPRFQIIETRAANRLVTMIENENDEKFNSYAATSYIPNTLRRAGYRIGRF